VNIIDREDFERCLRAKLRDTRHVFEQSETEPKRTLNLGRVKGIEYALELLESWKCHDRAKGTKS
jgi:hypothetical protein